MCKEADSFVLVPTCDHLRQAIIRLCSLGGKPAITTLVNMAANEGKKLPLDHPSRNYSELLAIVLSFGVLLANTIVADKDEQSRVEAMISDEKREQAKDA